MSNISSGLPMPQDQSDGTPVVNIPSSAVPPQLASAPHPITQQMSEIIVDGQRQLVSHDKLIEMAQKGVSSDSRYQEAAAKAKEADQAMNLKADLELLAETGDIGAFRRAGAVMGLSGDEVEEAARIVYEAENDDYSHQQEEGFDENTLYDAAGDQSRQGSAGQRIARLEAELSKTRAQLDGKTTRFSDLDDSLQDALVDVERNRVGRIIQEALDEDDVMCYYMNSRTPDGQGAIRTMIERGVQRRLDASPEATFGDGARILQDVIPEVRDFLVKTDTPERSTPLMGLGPAPGGQGGADIYQRKQPDHVPSTEAGFEEHIAETLQHNLFKAQQGGQQGD